MNKVPILVNKKQEKLFSSKIEVPKLGSEPFQLGSAQARKFQLELITKLPIKCQVTPTLEFRIDDRSEYRWENSLKKIIKI